MKKKITEAKKSEILRNYTVTGVPASRVGCMLKEMGLKQKDFDKFMFGQTAGLVGGEPLFYPWDIERFIKELPNLD